MYIDPSDVHFEPLKQRGIHAGGQNANKVANAVRATHTPTGITVVVRTRSLQRSKKEAIKALANKIDQLQKEEQARQKKARRDEKIKDRKYIRTYDFKSQRVTDHRTGKRSTIKRVLKEGHFEDLL